MAETEKAPTTAPAGKHAAHKAHAKAGVSAKLSVHAPPTQKT